MKVRRRATFACHMRKIALPWDSLIPQKPKRRKVDSCRVPGRRHRRNHVPQPASTLDGAWKRREIFSLFLMKWTHTDIAFFVLEKNKPPWFLKVCLNCGRFREKYVFVLKYNYGTWGMR